MWTVGAMNSRQGSEVTVKLPGRGRSMGMFFALRDGQGHMISKFYV